MRTPLRKTRVLIVARETVIAALLGLLLELEEYEPVFPLPHESPEEAIRRLRPPLVVVLDGEVDAARSDIFHARATQSGARIALFSEPLVADEVRAVARRRNVPYFTMPVDRETLGAVLARLAG